MKTPHAGLTVIFFLALSACGVLESDSNSPSADSSRDASTEWACEVHGEDDLEAGSFTRRTVFGCLPKTADRCNSQVTSAIKLHETHFHNGIACGDIGYTQTYQIRNSLSNDTMLVAVPDGSEPSPLGYFASNQGPGSPAYVQVFADPAKFNASKIMITALSIDGRTFQASGSINNCETRIALNRNAGASFSIEARNYGTLDVAMGSVEYTPMQRSGKIDLDTIKTGCNTLEVYLDTSAYLALRMK